MAKGSRGRERPTVRRITVDERLDEGLVRLLVAPLADKVEVITDSLEDWGTEGEELATPQSFLGLLGLSGHRPLMLRAAAELAGIAHDTSSDAATSPGRPGPSVLLWRALTEGQVFIVGSFRVEDDEHERKAIRLSEDSYDFLRIDGLPLVKNGLKELYTRALRAGRSTGE